MVGFSPRIHGIDPETSDTIYYKWHRTWWNGEYSIMLTKVSFLHKKYLDLFDKVRIWSVLRTQMFISLVRWFQKVFGKKFNPIETVKILQCLMLLQLRWDYFCFVHFSEVSFTVALSVCLAASVGVQHRSWNFFRRWRNQQRIHSFSWQVCN